MPLDSRRDCRDCAAFRREWGLEIATLGLAGLGGFFAQCASSRSGKTASGLGYCDIERMFEPPVGCGEHAARFEPRRRGMLRGWIWNLLRGNWSTRCETGASTGSRPKSGP